MDNFSTFLKEWIEVLNSNSNCNRFLERLHLAPMTGNFIFATLPGTRISIFMKTFGYSWRMDVAVDFKHEDCKLKVVH